MYLSYPTYTDYKASQNLFDDESWFMYINHDSFDKIVVRDSNFDIIKHEPDISRYCGSPGSQICLSFLEVQPRLAG